MKTVATTSTVTASSTSSAVVSMKMKSVKTPIVKIKTLVINATQSNVDISLSMDDVNLVIFAHSRTKKSTRRKRIQRLLSLKKEFVH